MFQHSHLPGSQKIALGRELDVDRSPGLLRLPLDVPAAVRIKLGHHQGLAIAPCKQLAVRTKGHRLKITGKCYAMFKLVLNF